MSNKDYIELFRENNFNVLVISKKLNVSIQEVKDIFATMYSDKTQY